jgi:hypothetical protein
MTDNITLNGGGQIDRRRLPQQLRAERDDLPLVVWDGAKDRRGECQSLTKWVSAVESEAFWAEVNSASRSVNRHPRREKSTASDHRGRQRKKVMEA